MKDFVEGLVLAIENNIISTKLAKAYINGYVVDQFGINFSDEQLSNIGSFYKATMDSELNAHINKNYPDLLKQPKNNK